MNLLDLLKFKGDYSGLSKDKVYIFKFDTGTSYEAIKEFKKEMKGLEIKCIIMKGINVEVVEPVKEPENENK